MSLRLRAALVAPWSVAPLSVASWSVAPWSVALSSVALAGVLGALAACSNSVDTSDNFLPGGDTGPAEDTAPAEDVPPGDCDCAEVGTWYRFTKLALESIEGGDHPVVPTLNSLWEGDIANRQLNIMFEVTAIAPTEITVRALNGAYDVAADDICLLPETEITITFPRSGCTLEQSAEAGINIYAGSTEHPKNCAVNQPVPHAIPVRRAVLEAEVTNDCGRIVNGYVPNAVLGEDELEQICTCLLFPPDKPASECGDLEPGYADKSNGLCQGCNEKYKDLKTMLTAFGNLDFNCEDDQGNSAACLTASFEAERIDSTPPLCP